MALFFHSLKDDIQAKVATHKTIEGLTEFRTFPFLLIRFIVPKDRVLL